MAYRQQVKYVLYAIWDDNVADDRLPAQLLAIKKMDLIGVISSRSTAPLLGGEASVNQKLDTGYEFAFLFHPYSW